MGFFGKKPPSSRAYAGSDASSSYSDTGSESSSAYSDSSYGSSRSGASSQSSAGYGGFSSQGLGMSSYGGGRSSGTSSSYGGSSSGTSSSYGGSSSGTSSSYGGSSSGTSSYGGSSVSSNYSQKRKQRVKDLPCVAPSTARTIVVCIAVTLAVVTALGFSTASDNSDRIDLLESYNGTDGSVGPQIAALRSRINTLETVNAGLQSRVTALEALQVPLEAWRTTGMTMNWVSGPNYLEGTGVQFRRDANFVYLRGGAVGNSVGGGTAFVLPVGYRPSSLVSFDRLGWRFQFYPNGNVVEFNCAQSSCDGVIFFGSGIFFARA